jgi:hypothetical protein
MTPETIAPDAIPADDLELASVPDEEELADELPEPDSRATPDEPAAP